MSAPGSGDAFARALSGHPPGFVDRLVKLTGNAIARFAMIPPGSRVLLGVSGGKDSLSLALALVLCRKRRYAEFELAAVRVDWIEARMDGEAAAAIGAYMDSLGIPYETVEASMRGDHLEPEPGCYRCARERKRRVFERAAECGFDRVAFGHTLDDVAGTAILNMVRHGRIEVLAPVRNFFGAVTVIRPLCMVRESSLRYAAGRLRLPVASIACPRKDDNERIATRAALVELEKMDTLVRENLFKALYPVEPGRIGRNGCPVTRRTWHGDS
ncbi:MAG: adenine nucleotide alpha hydrolase [Spirochaetes bacterium]|nr:adenine nucleotide alpha hydrolase [Spirochaetota bacterium]